MYLRKTMIEAVTKLTKSRKAIILVLIIAGLGVMVHLKLITAEQFVGVLEIVFPAWLLAHAGEEGAKAIGQRKKMTAAEMAKAIAKLMAAEDATAEPVKPKEDSEEEE